MLLYFFQGSLPWQGLKARDQTEKDELTLEKNTTKTEDRCGAILKEFVIYYDHICSLNFDETPAYTYPGKNIRHKVQSGVRDTIYEDT